MLTGNLFLSGVQTVSDKIPDNLYVGRLVCQVYDSFQDAREALEREAIQIESALLLRTDDPAGKQMFQRAWEASSRLRDSVILVEGKKLGDGLSGLVFYPTSLDQRDFFFQVETGDLLDYQIPAGKMNIDIPGEGIEKGKTGNKEVYLRSTPLPGIEIILEKYTRFYMFKGNSMDHLMIDCGFGGGNLKELMKGYAHGNWQLALTHGHKDHAGGCCQFRRLHGSKADLENAGILYTGQVMELTTGKVFRIGNRRISVIDLSGHSAVDFAYYVEPEKILICGDAIAIGPNYTMVRGGNKQDGGIGI